MARVIAALIRHGDYHQLPDTPSALQPFPLNAQGRQQAKEGAALLRELLNREGWTLQPRLHSSRQLRAWQTADILSQGLEGMTADVLRIESFDELAERSVGAAANLTLQQIESVLHQDPRCEAPPAGWKSNSHYCLPLQGAESLLQAGRRVADHLEAALRALQQQRGSDSLILFVGHGAAFRHAAHHLGILSFDQLARLSMFHCRPVLIERLDGGQWRHVGGDWKVRNRHDAFTD